MARTDLIKYVRMDKNGTKIYHDFTCPRCCGYGALDKWINTGKVCFACGGSGVRPVAKVVKEYTPEYLAKLESRRQAKAAKEAAERAKYESEHADEIAAERAEADRKILEFRFAEHGCGKDGVGYVLTGNTFKVKDEIKKAGGKWIYGRWVCPVDFKGNGIFSKRIDISSHISTGMYNWKDDGYDFRDDVTDMEG